MGIEIAPEKNTLASKQVILAVALMFYNTFLKQKYPQLEHFLSEGTLDFIINGLGLFGITIFRNVSTMDTSFTSKNFTLK